MLDLKKRQNKKIFFIILFIIISMIAVAILAQVYFLYRTDLFNIRANVFYIVVLIFSFLALVISYIYKKKFFRFLFLPLILFSLIKPLEQIVINYQINRAYSNAEIIIQKLTEYYAEHKTYPTNLNVFFSKNEPKYFIFLLPREYKYRNQDYGFELSIRSYNGTFLVYYSKYNKWLSHD
jgi:lysylphosphatidylglycerol synthetase-like protein (DUF2156 family)